MMTMMFFSFFYASGLLVSFVILRQGLILLVEAWRDLTDASVPLSTKKSIEKSLLPLLSTSSTPSRIPDLLEIRNLRARRAGAQMFVDLSAIVPATTTIERSSEMEEIIVTALKDARREISDVRVQFLPDA
jgi:divalent metal cation (Fe/Co/Zn/Cd) transporter